jgi:hypothetical protein
VLRLLVWIFVGGSHAEGIAGRREPLLTATIGVLQRRNPRPRLRNADQQFWICASRWFAGWIAKVRRQSDYSNRVATSNPADTIISAQCWFHLSGRSNLSGRAGEKVDHNAQSNRQNTGVAG